MWETIREYPLLGIGPLLGVVWVVWGYFGDRIARMFSPSASSTQEAWNVLAEKYLPQNSLEEIRLELMEEAVPWPEKDEPEE